jgi:hypothetical protein
LLTDVLAVRLPMSPDAANEKLVEAAFAGGTMRLRNVGNENNDRVSSKITRGETGLIRFA